MASYAYSIFGLSVLAVLLAGYLGQIYLPPPTPKVVGIDLGTTYSCIGVYQAVTGEVRVIPDGEGHKCIPSIVAFSDNEVLIGYKAAIQSEHNPRATIYDAKRFIGQKMSVEELKLEAARYPFKMFVNEKKEVQYNLDHIRIDDSKQDNGTIPLTKITPPHIGSYIIQTLKATAERNLSAPVTRAVLAVPAEFSERQRNYTRKAANLAGIEVLRIINEPTAAALAYGLHKKSGVRMVMVVDLGGGTLDVSLLHIQGGMFVTVAMAGNSHLGGQDFTHRLYKHLLKIIEKQYHQNMTHPEDLQAIRIAAENAKLHLTYHQTADINIPLHSLNNQRWTYTISTSEFNKLNSELFQKVLEPIQRILEDRELFADDVDEIVLVGGSTRIPKIRDIIREHFGKDLNVQIDPELAVTLGVSIQAGIIGGMWPLEVSAIEVPTAVKKIKLH